MVFTFPSSTATASRISGENAALAVISGLVPPHCAFPNRAAPAVTTFFAALLAFLPMDSKGQQESSLPPAPLPVIETLELASSTLAPPWNSSILTSGEEEVVAPVKGIGINLIIIDGSRVCATMEFHGLHPT